MEQKIPYKIYLAENEIPTQWYNVRADMKVKPAPLIHPGDGHPLTLEEMNPIFCEELNKQELDNDTAYFDIPKPDDLVFVSWVPGGEVFRSGCCWHRGRGRIFYFQPGHETFPTYYEPNVQKVIRQGVRWAYSPICWERLKDTHTTRLPDISLGKKKD